MKFYVKDGEGDRQGWRFDRNEFSGREMFSICRENDEYGLVFLDVVEVRNLIIALEPLTRAGTYEEMKRKFAEDNS